MPLSEDPPTELHRAAYDHPGVHGIGADTQRRNGTPGPGVIVTLDSGSHINATDQDGRCLRRYRRRWIVERTIGWLDNFRRLTVRYDRLMATYGGFFHLACALLVLRRVVK